MFNWAKILFLFFFLIFTQVGKAKSFSSNTQVSEGVAALLKELNYEGEFDLDSVYTYTQKNWLQFPKERWEFSPMFEEKRETLLPIFNQLHLIEKIEATKNEYDIAIIHGATLQRVRNRISFLAKEWNRGVRFKEIVFFSGPRNLEQSFESETHLLSPSEELPFKKGFVKPQIMPKNETEMMKFVFENAELPEGMEKLPTKFIHAEIRSKELFRYNRPTTADTILKWLEDSPKNVTVLCVSSQPYVSYQDIIMKYYVTPDIEVETIGDKASDKITVSSLLDNIAKCLYWEMLSHPSKTP